jgi:multidrug efflux pump subunit AcrA (membrane-fusion protein)
VSKQAAEAAASQARQDAAKLQLLRRRVGLEWGPSLARLSDARRSKLVADIAAGRAALVRIDSAQGLSQARGSAEIDLGAGGRTHAAILGPTRVGDPRLQSTGVLALVTGAEAMQLGTGSLAPATINAGGGGDGVVIPRAALLRNAGQTFVYIRRDAGDFERRTVPPGLSDPAGLFVTSGFRAGEAVVTAGAAQLFAAQSAPAGGKDVD